MAGSTIRMRTCSTDDCDKPAQRRGYLCDSCRGRKYRANQLATDPEGFRARNAAKTARLNAARKAEDPAAYNAAVRRWNLKKVHGITPDEYDEQSHAQGGLCAICKRPESAVDNSGNPRRLSVDHDHATGEKRGLLCANCNHVLGKVGDDVTLLANAIAYLNERGVWAWGPR